MKILTCIILSTVTIFSTFARSAENPEPVDNPLVKINILSKHVRLLREAKLEQIEITLPEDALIRDKHNIEHRCKVIIFTYCNNQFHALIDSTRQNSAFQYSITNSNPESVCTIKLDKEIRQYPAALQIKYSSISLEIYAWEQLDQYAVDSACAEYESSSWKEQEAVLALAHVIKARYFYTKKAPQHKDCDFCDLTHCQVYRGRTGSGLKFSNEWDIDHEKLNHNLFFHSRCGGHTFGTEVFGDKSNSETAKKIGVRDWIYHTGIQLCPAADSAWECSISEDELLRLLLDRQQLNDQTDKNPRNKKIEYDKNLNQFVIQEKEKSDADSFAPETVRLKINRVKGWNFLKSNNYTVAEESINNNKFFHFKGKGLGHGVGLCQHGALTLSRMGYNRYEILEHYFRDIKLIKQKETDSVPPYLSYCIFNLSDGSIRKLSSGRFLDRKAPPGSVFKLLISLYLVKERPDIFNDYCYICTGRNNDPAMPDHCWTQKGHGTINIKEAIPNSCNLFFASLYNKISYRHFKVFFDQFCNSLGIAPDFPEILNDKEWSNLLAGLDYRILFSISDYIKIIRFLKPDIIFEKDNFLNAIQPTQKDTIFQALRQTFIKGTASGSVKPYGSAYNYSDYNLHLEKANNIFIDHDIWGKTATTIDGTNQPVSYGLFIGGINNTGIIVLLRKGNGHLAAKWAQVLLSNNGL